ncbi:MAG: ATP-binding cassette domain-containing protein [Candidatus Hydrogenedentota bacterium]
MTTDGGVEVVNLRKVYANTVALDNVSLAFRPGEAHGVIGESGAGKSVLAGILAGAIQPTRGYVEVGGRRVVLNTPASAFRHGIATVHQAFSLIPGKTVGQNMFLGHMPRKWAGLAVDRPTLYLRARRVLEDFGIPLEARRKVSRLGTAERQMLEIAKAVARAPALLVLDDPASALSQEEREILFRLIRRLVKQDTAVVYLASRLDELRAVAHRVSVLRDGVLAATLPVEEATPQRVPELMAGNAVEHLERPPLWQQRHPVLKAEGLSRRGAFYGVDLSVRAGEIVAIAGLRGAGQTELLRAIIGAGPIDAGAVIVGGQRITRPRPRQMKRLGLVYATGAARRPVGQVASVANEWFHGEARVLLLDEPARGVDTHTRRLIWRRIAELSNEGVGVLWVSSELDALAALCHRILVIRRGYIRSEVKGESVTPRELDGLCAGA